MRILLRQQFVFLRSSICHLRCHIFSHIHTQLNHIVLQYLADILHQLLAKLGKLFLLQLVIHRYMEQRICILYQLVGGQHVFEALFFLEVFHLTNPRAPELVNCKRVISLFLFSRRSSGSGLCRRLRYCPHLSQIAQRRHRSHHWLGWWRWRRCCRFGCRRRLWRTHWGCSRRSSRLRRWGWCWFLHRLCHWHLYGLHQPTELHQCQFHCQTFVLGSTVLNIASIHDIQRIEQPLGIAMLGLLLIALTNGIRCLQQLCSGCIFAHQYIAQMLRKARHEMSCIKALDQHLVQQQQCRTHVLRQRCIHQTEIVIGIQYVQHLYRLLVADCCAAERHQLVEDTQRIAHTAIRLLRHHIQRLFAGIHTLFLGYVLQMMNRISHCDTTEVIHLAAA